jgi:hypothetical protein
MPVSSAVCDIDPRMEELSVANMQESPIVWRTSTASNGTNCVEVAFVNQAVLVRDSKNRANGALSLSPSAWQDFIAAVRQRQHGFQ